MTVSALQPSGLGLRFIHDVTCALAPLLPVIYSQQHLNLESLIRFLWFDPCSGTFFNTPFQLSLILRIQLSWNSCSQGNHVKSAFSFASFQPLFLSCPSHYASIRCFPFAVLLQTCSTFLLSNKSRYKLCPPPPIHAISSGRLFLVNLTSACESKEM
jgi:hypothetical protein